MQDFLDRAVVAFDETTGFSREERQAVLDLLAERTSGGGVRGPLHSVILARLGRRDFGWPEFDRWHEFFASRGAFPPLWRGLEQTPSPRASSEIRQAYQEEKLYLLVDWLLGLAASRAETRAALARYARRRLPAEITRQGDGAPCPVCDPLDHSPVKYNQRAIPPFHPGCRCLVLASAAGEKLPPVQVPSMGFARKLHA